MKAVVMVEMAGTQTGVKLMSSECEVLIGLDFLYSVVSQKPIYFYLG